jgi:predicted small lipoprotein YifL
MKRVFLSIVALMFTLGMLNACGVKSPPKYVPDSEQTEKSKS